MEGFKQNFERYIKDNDKNKEFEDQTHKLNKDTKQEILSIQEEKINLVSQMHELLKKVDADESISFTEYARSITLKDGQFIIIKKGGIKEVITVGDILVAGMNGFNIKLEPEVDRLTKKRFILQETRRKIKNLYNDQLIQAELENTNNDYKDGALGAYKKISETKNSKVYENRQSGILAEQMVESFMTKIIANNPNLPFTIEMADVYDDVRRKMDFRLHIKEEYTRGIKVDTQQNTGIQLTMNSSKTEFKQRQIQRSKQRMNKLDKKPVDDLVLVTISIDEIQDSLDSWIGQGKKKSIAGPAEHWSVQTQKLVFTKMLEKLPKELNINPNELWESTQIENSSNLLVAA